MLHRPAATLAVPLVLALALSACSGTSTSTTATSGGDSATSASATSAPPSSPTSPPPATGGPPSPPPSPGGGSGGGGSGSAFLEITRSGGIAGVRDVVRVAADGTGKMANRQGGQRTCRPPAAAVQRLRRMDLAALAALPSPTAVVNDGFVFSVRSPAGAAVVGEGDKNGRRADLLDAAAAVISACVVGLPRPTATMR